MIFYGRVTDAEKILLETGLSPALLALAYLMHGKTKEAEEAWKASEQSNQEAIEQQAYEEAAKLKADVAASGTIGASLGAAQGYIVQKQAEQEAQAAAKRREMEAQRVEQKEEQIESLSMPPAPSSPQPDGYDAVEALRASNATANSQASAPQPQQSIWGSITNFFQQKIVQPVQTTWDNYVYRPIIQPAATWIQKNIVQPVQNAWDNYVYKPIIQPVTTWAQENIVQPVQKTWSKLTNAVTPAYQQLTKPGTSAESSRSDTVAQSRPLITPGLQRAVLTGGALLLLASAGGCPRTPSATATPTTAATSTTAPTATLLSPTATQNPASLWMQLAGSSSLEPADLHSNYTGLAHLDGWIQSNQQWLTAHGYRTDPAYWQNYPNQPIWDAANHYNLPPCF